MAWIGDGSSGPSYVASGSDEGHVFLWDYDSANVVRILPVQDRLVPTCLAVSPPDLPSRMHGLKLSADRHLCTLLHPSLPVPYFCFGGCGNCITQRKTKGTVLHTYFCQLANCTHTDVARGRGRCRCTAWSP